jgi:hypothetical protein
MECIHSKFVKAKSIYSTCLTCGILLKITEDIITPVIKDDSPTYSDLNWQDTYYNMKAQSNMKLKPLPEKYLTCRSELIDYVKSLNYKFKFSDITLHLAIYIMDIIGNNEDLIENNRLELIAVACLLLSCNYY